MSYDSAFYNSKSQFIGAVTYDNLTGGVWPIAGQPRAGGGTFEYDFFDERYQGSTDVENVNYNVKISQGINRILSDNPAYNYASCAYANGDTTRVYINLYIDLTLPSGVTPINLDPFSTGLNQGEYVTCKGDNTNAICTNSTNKWYWAIYRKNLNIVYFEYLNPLSIPIVRFPYDLSNSLTSSYFSSLFGEDNGSLLTFGDPTIVPYNPSFVLVNNSIVVRQDSDLNKLLLTDQYYLPEKKYSTNYYIDVYVNNKFIKSDFVWSIDYSLDKILNLITGTTNTYTTKNFPFKINKFQYSVINDNGSVKKREGFIVYKLNILLDTTAPILTNISTPNCNVTNGQQTWTISDNFNIVNAISTCLVNCVVDEWKDSTTCNPTDGKKTQTRNVTVTAKNGGTACPPLTQIIDCPVNCVVDEWKDSTTCNPTDGKKTQTRNVTITAKNGGTACPPLTQIIDCPVDCKVSNWTTSQQCNVFTGKGEEKRTILVNPLNGGVACPSLRVRETTCTPTGLYGVIGLVVVLIGIGGVLIYKKMKK